MIVMSPRVFIDSNVWVYLFGDDDNSKRIAAEEFIRNNSMKQIFVISYQVINEVTNTLKRKGFSEAELRRVIEYLSKICMIQDYSKDIALHASMLREENGFSFWDSHIVASALATQCNVLVSEDMQDGQMIGNMVIKDIFKA
jgi:predicted nucleic acid-binding protein